MVLSAAVPELYNGPRDWDSLHDFYSEIWNSYGMMTDIEFVLLLSISLHDVLIYGSCRKKKDFFSLLVLQKKISDNFF